MPRPTPLDPREGLPLSLSGYKVNGRIDGQAADLSFDIVFHNPTSQRLEGMLVIPIPQDTVLSGFTMTNNGKTMKGELLESGQAASVYQSIVSQLRDPGLLELVGERMLRARVFPIEPNGDITVHVGWTQIVHQSGGLYSLSVPLRSARFLEATGGRASANLELTTDRPLRTVYSPIPDVRVERDGDRKASVRYEPSPAEASDLSLFYSMATDPLGVGLLTHREEGEDGFFLLSVSPKLEPEANPVPKDMLFVVDRSGSMQDDGKLEQAKKAIEYCLSKLGPNDRFGIVDFATDSSSIDDRLLAATPENKVRAKRYVERLEAAGGTNIDAALEEGTRILKHVDGRMPMVFFLTDGLPTVGETDMNGLIKRFAEENSNLKARVFTFGVGSDVNTLFLDKLAEGNRGAHDYILPGETIENKVSSLYQKVGHPALTDVRIEWNGAEVDQVYPRPVPDLFYGSELVLMGRTITSGKGTLVISGNAGAKHVRFEFPVEFPKNETRHEFLPRLWANLKVAHEVDAIRLNGNPDPEVVKDIVRLAKRYGIVTPYTSFLITEDGADLHNAHGVALQNFRAMNMDAVNSGVAGGGGVAMRAQHDSNFLGFFNAPMAASVAAAPATDGLATGLPLPETAHRKMAVYSAPAAPAMFSVMKEAEKKAREEVAARGEAQVETKQVADKTFYLRGGRWIDGAAEASDDEARRVEVGYLSKEYFDLLNKIPALSRYLSIGSNVTVSFDGIVYQVVEK